MQGNHQCNIKPTIITNILLRLQKESKHNLSSLKLQVSEIRFASTLSMKSNTVIPQQWLHHIPHQYQVHFDRISDFLASGNGSWWRESQEDIQFFDAIIGGSSQPHHQMFHFRSTKLTDLESPYQSIRASQATTCHSTHPSTPSNMFLWPRPPQAYVSLSGHDPQPVYVPLRP